MISVSKALSILNQHRVSTKLVRKEIGDCLGYRLATDLLADLTLPPHDASAMDGYAVRLEDVRETGSRLTVIGDVPAGSSFAGVLQSGQAVRIFTGSPIPKGADHVIIQEHVERSQDQISTTQESNASQHIRRAGIDFHKGDLIGSKGQRLGQADIALAAAANYGTLPVYDKPKVAILAAGDELVLPGQADGPGDIVNSNTAALTSLVKAWGGTVCFTGLAKDDPDAIRIMFDTAKDADLIVPVGGASVGEHDHMRRVFNRLGGKMLFEKIAVKPGKPTWFGLLRDTPVLGLPGNPASAIVCAHLFLRALIHGPQMTTSKAILTKDLPANGSRETYLRGRVTSHDANLLVTPFPRQDSSLLTPFREANVLIQRNINAPALKEGDWADVRALGTGPSLFA